MDPAIITKADKWWVKSVVSYLSGRKISNFPSLISFTSLISSRTVWSEYSSFIFGTCIETAVNNYNRQTFYLKINENTEIIRLISNYILTQLKKSKKYILSTFN